MRQRQWCRVVHNRTRAAPIFIRARIRTHTHTHTRQGPRSLRVVDIAFFDDGRCSYASNRAGLDGPYAPPRHGHDTRRFGWSRIPLDLQGRQVCLSVCLSLCLCVCAVCVCCVCVCTVCVVCVCVRVWCALVCWVVRRSDMPSHGVRMLGTLRAPCARCCTRTQ